MDAATIIAAIEAGITLIPQGLALVEQAKELLGADDKASVVAKLDEQADALHAARTA